MVLVKAGVPYDTAMRMPAARRMAHVVVLGELEGGKFDWTSSRWKDDQ